MLGQVFSLQKISKNKMAEFWTRDKITEIAKALSLPFCHLESAIVVGGMINGKYCSLDACERFKQLLDKDSVSYETVLAHQGDALQFKIPISEDAPKSPLSLTDLLKKAKADGLHVSENFKFISREQRIDYAMTISKSWDNRDQVVPFAEVEQQLIAANVQYWDEYQPKSSRLRCLVIPVELFAIPKEASQ